MKTYEIKKKDSVQIFATFENKENAMQEMENMRIWHGWDDLYIQTINK